MSSDEAFDDLSSALRRQDESGGERGEVRNRSFRYTAVELSVLNIIVIHPAA